MTPWLSIVGIGEDGLTGLGQHARRLLAQAEVLFGGERHLALVPEIEGQERIPWPTPFAAAYDRLLAYRGRPVCVLASGDPMVYGIGGSLGARVPAQEMRILPAPSSVSLAAARMGWALQEVRVVPAHGRPLERVNLHLAPGARLIVLSADGQTPARLAEQLTARGYGETLLTVFERLGGEGEIRREGRAEDWPHADCGQLNLVACECRPAQGCRPLSRRAALPDEAYCHDGQLTKRDVRAVTLAHLAPMPGELLWDVGAGCGSIGIEWMRADSRCRAIAIESDPFRQGLIQRNRIALGVPDLVLVAGRAPEALERLETPNAIFIGGGLTVSGVAERCWEALEPGGRLVANAVTLQSESFLMALRERIGGELTRIAVAHAEPLGRFDAWRAAIPVTILTAVKPVFSGI